MPRNPTEGISEDKCRPPVLAPAVFQPVASPGAVRHSPSRAVKLSSHKGLPALGQPTAQLAHHLAHSWPAQTPSSQQHPHSPTHLGGEPKKDTLLSFSSPSSDRTHGLSPRGAAPNLLQWWARSVSTPVPRVSKISFLPQLVMDLVFYFFWNQQEKSSVGEDQIYFPISSFSWLPGYSHAMQPGGLHTDQSCSSSHLACSLLFVSCSPSSSKNSCQHPGNICLGISTTVWSHCSSVWDLCLQRKSVQQQHRERKKGGKRALYIRINRAVAIVTWS